jgi:N-acetylglucosaminyl-diphospho-decaprenol L-rhamnosyltransferase
MRGEAHVTRGVDVSVIIVNFNSSAQARRCLESAAADLDDTAGRQTPPRVDWTAIIVDNASSDGGPSALQGLPRTVVIANDRNVGFGAAVNQAARTTNAGLLWVLNPDCEVLPGAFAALVETLDRHADCAIAAPQLLNADGSVQASARGEPTAWTGLFGRHTLLTRFFPSSRLARRNLPARDLVLADVESAPVDWVMGAAMLVRREMFDRVDGFDQRYFLYWEDADLCRRLRDRGYATRYVPRARVIHAGGASANTQSALATRAFHRSAYLYYATHVVRSRWHPMRWVARVALTARAFWRMSR